jgi:hypothetical protein
MKKLIFYALIVTVLTSCGQKTTVFENSTSEEKWKILQDYYMVPGATASNERTLPNVLSEQEVLLKAADAAIKEGVLDPTYYMYQEIPALMDAKIETPILITDSVSGNPNMYMLTAVDDAGVLLAEIYVNSASVTNDADFELGRGFAIPNTSYHYITKREATDLIREEFQNRVVSEPMAVYNLRLGDDPHSHRAIFWYFTVDENTRDAIDNNSEEYILAAGIFGYSSIIGGISNRAAINLGPGGSPHLNGYRLAKLDTPLRLNDKLNAARAAGGVAFSPSVYPNESITFTPVPLK